MKIYTLYHDECSEKDVVCVSEDIEMVKRTICEMCRDRAFPYLEIWENGELLETAEGNSALRLLTKQ